VSKKGQYEAMAKNDGLAAPSPRRRKPRVPVGALLLFAAAILLFLVGLSPPGDRTRMDGAASKEGAGVGSCALPGSHAEAVEAAEGVLMDLPPAVEKELGEGAGPGERLFAEAVVRQEERKAANKKAKNERKSKKAAEAAQKSAFITQTDPNPCCR